MGLFDRKYIECPFLLVVLIYADLSRSCVQYIDYRTIKSIINRDLHTLPPPCTLVEVKSI